MTRMEWCQKAQPAGVFRRAIFGFVVISSLGLVFGLRHTTGRLFVRADEGQSGAPVSLRLEVGQVKPLTVATDSGQPTLVEMSVRTVAETKSNSLPHDIPAAKQAASSDEGEVWIEADQPDAKTPRGDQPTMVSEPAGEIWLEEEVAADKAAPSAHPAEVPAPVNTDVIAGNKRSHDRPSGQQYCRIILGETDGTVLQMKKARVVYPADSQTGEMTVHRPVAKEPVLPSPWAGSLVVPENTPVVVRKVRESLELNQTLTVGGMGTLLGRTQPAKVPLYVQAQLSPEPVRHNDVTLTSGESQVAPAPREKEPAGEAVVTGWEFPGRVSDSAKSEPTVLAITSATSAGKTDDRGDRQSGNDPKWELIPIQKPVGSAESQPTVWDRFAQRVETSSGNPAASPAQSMPEQPGSEDRRVRPVVTSSEVPISEAAPIKVTEFANQSVPSPRATLVAEENTPQSGQPLVEVAPSESQTGQAESQEPSFEVIEESGELTVIVRRSKLLRTKVDVYRTAVVDSGVCDVVQFTPREISILGKSQGATHVTFWFQDERYRPITYLVRVIPDPEVEKQQNERYELLESHLAKLFPESKVDLVVVGDKLVVRGQARDAAEAAQIMAIIRGELVRARGVMEGQASDPVGREAAGQALPAIQVINMLRIPGPPQVALKVKIAELNRSAARNFGVDMQLNFDQGKFLIQSLLNLSSGGSASILGNFDGGDLKFGLHYLEEHGVVRLLSEPTLITLSGRPATFIAGGEFAVPTTVGVNGVGAVTTDFRAYGAIITFLPTVLDKDLIRLEVAPEFSQLDTKNKVNGTPGLRTRAVTTTVEMREGQTLAIAGLLDDSMTGNNQGDLPIFNQIFGRRSLSRNETELIILVTPELVHPMEPEEVPPLPGFDVTEPTNHEFYLKGHLEGRPTQEYDSTTWPRLRRRYNAGGPATISGPFGHGE